MCGQSENWRWPAGPPPQASTLPEPKPMFVPSAPHSLLGLEHPLDGRRCTWHWVNGGEKTRSLPLRELSYRAASLSRERNELARRRAPRRHPTGELAWRLDGDSAIGRVGKERRGTPAHVQDYGKETRE